MTLTRRSLFKRFFGALAVVPILKKIIKPPARTWLVMEREMSRIELEAIYPSVTVTSQSGPLVIKSIDYLNRTVTFDIATAPIIHAGDLLDLHLVAGGASLRVGDKYEIELPL